MPEPTYVRLDDNGLLYLLTLLEAEISSSGEENAIEIIKRNGVTLSIDPTDKSVNVLVPTDADIESLITAHGYQTSSQVQTAIDNALADITGIDFQVVNSLPATGTKGVIYLLSNSGTGQNVYDEYIWLDGDPTGHYEMIGTTAVDLSGYVQANEMHALTNAEIDTIFNQVFGS